MRHNSTGECLYTHFHVSFWQMPIESHSAHTVKREVKIKDTPIYLESHTIFITIVSKQNTPFCS